MAKRGHEQVIFNFDKATGLRAIIAVHDTTLGPAIGGCRMWPYQSESDALHDALRLSEGMTFKAAAAGLDYGGGKVVILGDPEKDKDDAMFRALGRFVDTLAGRFITGEDVGTNADDLVHASKETPHVIGLPPAYGGSGDTGDHTAFGVIQAMRAALMHRYGSSDLAGRRVAVQGLGKVGYAVAREATALGAEVMVADINPQQVGRASAELGVEPVDPWTILEVETEILAPCALGEVISEHTLPRLNCHIIAGSANNQLAGRELAEALQSRGILYAPDFIANAGGLIQVVNERAPGGYHDDRARHQIEVIYDVLLGIFQEAERTGRSTLAVAMETVERRLMMLQAIHRLFSTGQG